MISSYLQRMMFVVLCLLLSNTIHCDDLRLLSGDILKIRVFGQPDLDQDCRVSFDGKIKVLGSGSFSVFDQTSDELEQAIVEGFKNKSALNDPQIVLHVAQTVPRSIFVQGAFKDTKAVSFQYGQTITLRQVIAEVGGFQDGANIKELKIFRHKNPFNIKEIERISIDYFQHMSTDKPVSILMQSGDIIFVETLADITINGAVRSPGAFKLKPGEELNCENLINRFGGFVEDSQRAYYTLKRNGQSHLIPFSESESVSLGISKELYSFVKPGDSIVVHYVDQVFVDGYVNSPGAFKLPIEEPMSLRKVIVLAGGSKLEAKLNKVKIMRKKLGVVKVVEVDISKLDEKDEEFYAKPGDYIYVPRSFY